MAGAQQLATVAFHTRTGPVASAKTYCWCRCHRKQPGVAPQQKAMTSGLTGIATNTATSTATSSGTAIATGTGTAAAAATVRPLMRVNPTQPAPSSKCVDQQHPLLRSERAEGLAQWARQCKLGLGPGRVGSQGMQGPCPSRGNKFVCACAVYAKPVLIQSLTAVLTAAALWFASNAHCPLSMLTAAPSPPRTLARCRPAQPYALPELKPNAGELGMRAQKTVWSSHSNLVRGQKKEHVPSCSGSAFVIMRHNPRSHGSQQASHVAKQTGPSGGLTSSRFANEPYTYMTPRGISLLLSAPATPACPPG
jgi:hypothetical protein